MLFGNAIIRHHFPIEANSISASCEFALPTGSLCVACDLVPQCLSSMPTNIRWQSAPRLQYDRSPHTADSYISKCGMACCSRKARAAKEESEGYGTIKFVLMPLDDGADLESAIERELFDLACTAFTSESDFEIRDGARKGGFYARIRAFILYCP